MDENEFTADEAEKVNEWGRKTLDEARLNEPPQQYELALLSEYGKVMSTDAVALHFYRVAREQYGLDHEYGLCASIVALSNANKTLRDGQTN